MRAVRGARDRERRVCKPDLSPQVVASAGAAEFWNEDELEAGCVLLVRTESRERGVPAHFRRHQQASDMAATAAESWYEGDENKVRPALHSMRLIVRRTLSWSRRLLMRWHRMPRPWYWEITRSGAVLVQCFAKNSGDSRSCSGAVAW